MSSRQRVSFGDETWSLGTRGRESRWVSKRPVISNMRWSKRQLLEPRARWRTGIVSTDISTAAHAAGTLHPLTDGIFMGQDAYSWDAPASVTDHTLTPIATTGTLTSAVEAIPTTPLSVGADDGVLVLDRTIRSGFPYSFSTGFTTDVTTHVGSAWTPLGTAIHQGRLFGFGNPNPNRIWYSDAYDYLNVASASQFFDVDGTIGGIVSSGSMLLIWTVNGDWYMLQGRGDPSLGTINYIGTGKVPSYQYGLAQVDNGFIFSSRDHSGLVFMSNGGAQDDTSLAHLGYSTVSQGFQALSSYLHAAPHSSGILDVITGPVRADGSHLISYNKVWSEDRYFGSFDLPADTILFVDENTGRECAAIPPGASGSGNWELYSRNFFDGAADSDSDAGLAEGAVNGYIETPLISVPDKLVRVERVYIDVQGLGSTISGGSPPAPSLTVKSQGQTTTTLTLGPGATPLTSKFTLGAGDDVRLVATPGPTPYERGFNIVLADIRGLRIERVTVDLSISEGPTL